MKFLFASDSFKGTLSSARIAELLTTAAKESFQIVTAQASKLQMVEKERQTLFCVQ